MIAQAQSGTGKTAAFALTMLSRVISENKWPQCLCLAPTYELAMQIGQVVQNMAEFLPEIKIRYAIKGERSKCVIKSCVKRIKMFVVICGTPRCSQGRKSMVSRLGNVALYDFFLW